MDAEIRALSDALLTIINTSPIPMEAKRLVIENLLIKVTEKANQMISEQIKAKETENAVNNRE